MRKHKTYKDILEQAWLHDYVEIENGNFYLYSQNGIIEEQKQWKIELQQLDDDELTDEQVDSIEFDFTKAKYWIQSIGDDVIFTEIHCLKDLIDFFEDYKDAEKYFN